MSGDNPVPGPEVELTDDLYRCITTPDWWVAEEGRPSSAAFKHPDFSTDVVRLAGSPEYTLQRFQDGSGLVLFNYKTAKEIGFVARIETDPEHPENFAHANVYSDPKSSNRRKAMAQRLIQAIIRDGGVVVAPSFP